VTRQMTITIPLDPADLLDGPRTRADMGLTRYAIQLAEKEGIVVRAGGKSASGYLWKLTPKGRRRAKK
jgi:hypothetical protein